MLPNLHFYTINVRSSFYHDVMSEMDIKKDLCIYMYTVYRCVYENSIPYIYIFVYVFASHTHTHTHMRMFHIYYTHVSGCCCISATCTCVCMSHSLFHICWWHLTEKYIRMYSYICSDTCVVYILYITVHYELATIYIHMLEYATFYQFGGFRQRIHIYILHTYTIYVHIFIWVESLFEIIRLYWNQLQACQLASHCICRSADSKVADFFLQKHHWESFFWNDSIVHSANICVFEKYYVFLHQIFFQHHSSYFYAMPIFNNEIIF